MPGGNVFQLTWEHLGCLKPDALLEVRGVVLTALSLNYRCLRAMQPASQHASGVTVRPFPPNSGCWSCP